MNFYLRIWALKTFRETSFSLFVKSSERVFIYFNILQFTLLVKQNASVYFPYLTPCLYHSNPPKEFEMFLDRLRNPCSSSYNYSKTQGNMQLQHGGRRGKHCPTYRLLKAAAPANITMRPFTCKSQPVLNSARIEF